jgi:hypothetical protein
LCHGPQLRWFLVNCKGVQSLNLTGCHNLQDMAVTFKYIMVPPKFGSFVCHHRMSYRPRLHTLNVSFIPCIADDFLEHLGQVCLLHTR